MSAIAAVKEIRSYMDLFNINSNQAWLLCRMARYYSESKCSENGKKYFTIQLSALAKESHLSLRTISNYLKEFREQYIIETWCRLSSTRKELRISVTKTCLSPITRKGDK